MFFFGLSSLLLILVLLAVMVGAAAVGLLVGRSLRESREKVSESFGVLQAALLGFTALILGLRPVPRTPLNNPDPADGLVVG